MESIIRVLYYWEFCGNKKCGKRPIKDILSVILYDYNKAFIKRYLIQ